jgi:plastocyanin
MKLVFSAALGITLILLIAQCSKNSSYNSSGVTAPVLTTHNVSSITQTAVLCGGTITSDGGAAVTVRGVCWGTSHDPTTANSKTSDGTSTGSFVSTLTGLTAGTTYFARAYATNSAGTGYGNDESFTTLSAGGTTASISIVSMTTGFSPSTKSVTVGTVVTWHNNDGVTHTVTSDNGTSFDSGNIAPGGSFSYTATTAGTIAYHCSFHPGMMGTLTVTP